MLPYLDKKSKGAPDFYFAINATFRFIRERFGMQPLVRYWDDLGKSEYFKPVADDWTKRGRLAVAEYWRDFFAAEPDAQVDVIDTGSCVEIKVSQCPAIHHMRKHTREIVPEFCQHCYFVSQSLADRAGWEVRITGGAGSCSQSFGPKGTFAPQEISSIKRVEKL